MAGLVCGFNMFQHPNTLCDWHLEYIPDLVNGGPSGVYIPGNPTNHK